MNESSKDRIKNLSREEIKKLLALRSKSAKKDSKTFLKMVRNSEQVYPISKAQERIWFLDNIIADSSLYNIPIAVRQKSKISFEEIKNLVEIITDKNEILRTVFIEVDGAIVQKINTKCKTSVEYEDISFLNSETKKLNTLEQKIKEFTLFKFDLSQLPLFKVKLIKLNELDFILVINIHHIISDGWTNMLISNDFNKSRNQLEKANPKKYSYIDYVQWEKNWFKTNDYKNKLQFWKNKFYDKPANTQFPKDRNSNIDDYAGGTIVSNLRSERYTKVSDYCKKNNITEFQLFFFCYSLLVSIYSQEKEVIIGVPVANRGELSFNDTYGLFFNTLPIRIKISKEVPYTNQLHNFAKEINEYFKYSSIPFSEIIRVINPDRNLGSNVLFDIHFAYQKFPTTNVNYELLTLNNLHSKFDLNFWVEIAGGNCKFSINYRKKFISESLINRFISDYNLILEEIIEKPNLKPFESFVYNNNKNSRLKSVELVYKEKSFLDFFYNSLEGDYNSVAVVDSNTELTYGELNREANLLANFFVKNGVEQKDVIILNTGRSVSFIIGVIASFKMGCAYLPVREDIPEERLAFIIRDSNAKAIFTNKNYKGIINITTNYKDTPVESNQSELRPKPLESKDIAYINYTSGTTGRPKGVIVSHKAVVNYTNSINEKLKNENIKSIAHISSIDADLGNTSIFHALSTGAKLLLPSTETVLNTELLIQYFERNPADALKIVPTHLEAYSDSIMKILPKRTLIMGGGVFTQSLYNMIKSNSPKLSIYNHYGPTETTIGVIVYKLDKEIYERTIPIGKPIYNTEIRIIDEDNLSLPLGVVGEIIVAGDSLSEGYVGGDSIDSNNFIKIDGERFYKTGDKGFINENGEIEFVGRNDYQIKFNGFRIELNEIETVIKNHDCVSNTAVFVLKEKEKVVKIVACVVLDKETTESELLLYLKKYLPASHLPHIIIVDSISITKNGKTDYNTLRNEFSESIEKSTNVLPVDLVELKLLDIFKKIFSSSNISVDDNFFDIGGHSLLAIKLIVKINKEFGLDLNISTLYIYSSVREIAKRIRNEDKKSLEIDFLVNLSENSNSKKSVWIHPAGGNIMCYYPIAKELSDEIDTYAFSYKYGNNSEESIRKLATEYSSILISNEYVNNIIVSGWSMGAVIAHQTAIEVKKKTSKLLPVVLIDQPALSKNTELESYSDKLLNYLEKVNLFTNDSFNLKEIRKSNLDINVILGEFIRLNLTPEETTYNEFEIFLNTLISHNDIVSNHKPELYEGPVLLIKAEENLMDSDENIDNDLSWGEFCDNLTVVIVPGNHISMMNLQNSKNIGKVVLDWWSKL